MIANLSDTFATVIRLMLTSGNYRDVYEKRTQSHVSDVMSNLWTSPQCRMLRLAGFFCRPGSAARRTSQRYLDHPADPGGRIRGADHHTSEDRDSSKG
jgi:hypothetical protein